MSLSSFRQPSLLVLALAGLFFIYDIASDILSGDDSILHLGTEFVVFAGITVLFYLEWLRHSRARAALSEEKQRTAKLTGELVAVMRSRFEEWGLTQSEGDIALLLIKGLSMKQIAEARGVKEKTVRQQAAAIYAKSDCAGRHELVAGFIEDLLAGV